MSYKATCEDDDSSDSEQAQTDLELSPLLTNHSSPESASPQRALSRNVTIMGHMIPGGVSAVVKPFLKMRHLISHHAAIMAHFIVSLKAWIQTHKKQTAVIVAGIIPFALSLATPAILGAIGFSAAGPVLGSVAAGWQASMGSVAAGSLFAFLQSAAMGGAAMGLFTGVGVLGALIAGGGALSTVQVVMERCEGFMEEVATAVTGVYQNAKSGVEKLWQNFWSPDSKTKIQDE